MNTTVRLKASDINKDWHVIDAAGRPLGRVASEAAVLLRGKHKPTFEPHLDCGDFVIIVNAAQVRVTGRKAEQIEYHSHSGYPGGLKTRSYAHQLARYPERVLEQAIYGMLPKGPLGHKVRKHLKVYKGAKHPHQSQIVGSERARAAREAALEEALGDPMKPRRLRPLGGIQLAAAPVDESRQATIDAELEAQAEAPAVLTDETPRTEGHATPVPSETAITSETAIATEAGAAEEAPAPKRRTRRKAAAETTEATPEAAPEASQPENEE